MGEGQDRVGQAARGWMGGCGGKGGRQACHRRQASRPAPLGQQGPDNKQRCAGNPTPPGSNDSDNRSSQRSRQAEAPAHLQAHAAGALVVVKVLQGLEAPALLAEADLQQGGGGGGAGGQQRNGRKGEGGPRQRRRWLAGRPATGAGTSPLTHSLPPCQYTTRCSSRAHLLAVAHDAGDLEVLLAHLVALVVLLEALQRHGTPLHLAEQGPCSAAAVGQREPQ